jgi:hypothetical protein
MSLGNLYDVLDLKPDASLQEVREAYQRTKSAYNKDSLALYTLISAGEREEILRRVEEAYEVLSDGDKRREYDRCHGNLDLEQETAMFPHSDPRSAKKVISIDRVPPMDSSTDDLLVAPSTDFAGGLSADEVPEPAAPYSEPAPTPAFDPTTPATATAAASPLPSSAQVASASHEPVLEQEISAEREWKGSLLRKIRDARKVSMEELSHATKISKTYITALEEEDYKRLPAPVFVRGFLLQICRILKIPGESVVAPYMSRYNQARAGKD